jgi:hypothetical protein
VDPKRQYASYFLEESVGLARGSVDPGAVPAEFVGALVDAMGGSERSRSPEPLLERLVQRVGHDIIRSILETQGCVAYKERWPHAAKYAACLTHDVDTITRPILHVLQRRVRFSKSNLFLTLTGLRNPYDNISYVVGLERERNLRSSFYFLSGAYDLKPRAAQLSSIAKAGWDVGLHGDFGTHDSQEKMSEALSRIKQMTGISAVGVREHYLRFDFPSTWKIMEGAGLKYDTTVGNSDKLGFRIGLCNPFHPPDENWNPRRLLELPLVLMDTTLWGYLKATEAQGMREFDGLKRSVESVNGLFTILWHQEAARMKGGRIYPTLLDILLKDGCYFGSGLAVADWWLERSAPLVNDGKTFRMEDAPAGLVLKSKSKRGEEPRVIGAEVTVDGEAATIKAKGGPLEVVYQ